MSIQTLNASDYLAVLHNKLKSFNLISNTITDLTGTGHSGSFYFDGVTWQGRWYVSQASDFAYYDGSNWTTGLGTLGGSNKFHPMCVHEGLDQLAIGEDNKVFLFNSSHSPVTTITLSVNFQVRWIRYNNDYLYIGTKNIYGGEAEIFVADGQPSTIDPAVSLFNSSSVIPGCQWAFSGVIYAGVLVVMASNGQLLYQNGSGWSELAHLPVYNNPSYVWYDSGYLGGKVAQRGMAVKGERIFINIDGYVNIADGNQLSNQPSGLWIYEKEVGLYHHAGLATDSFLGANASTGVDLTTNVITTSSPIPTITGTKVVLTVTNCTGLIVGRYYYLIYLSPTTYKLASSYNNAIAGTAISLGTGTSVTLSGSENQSFGQSFYSGYQPGAIILINDLNVSLGGYYSSSASQLLFGAGIVPAYTSSTSYYTLQSLTMGENRGTFITTKIFSAGIKETWQAIVTKYNKLFQGNDKIIVKYKILEKENYPLYGDLALTWVNATSFTSTFDFSQISVGDEIEFTSGRGAGCSAHIVSATNNAGTWTVVIDEAILGVTAGDSSYTFMIDNWKKRDVIIPPVVDNFTRIPDEGSAKWIQLKFEIRGVSEPYIEEIDLINKTLMPLA
jgi:hypothetical protein